MSFVGLFLSGAVLFLNSLTLLGKAEVKSVGIFNLFVGCIQLIIPLYLIIVSGHDHWELFNNTSIFLFGLTYLYFGVTVLKELDGNGLGWFCLWVTVIAVVYTLTEIIHFHDAVSALTWGMWAFLWFLFFLSNSLKKKKLYSAIPLNLVIEKLTKEFQADIEQLKNNSYKKVVSNDRVWSLKVDSSIQLQCKQLLREAKHSIKISLWEEELTDYLPLLIEKEQAGVSVEALVVGEIQEELPISTFYTLSPVKEHHTLEKNRLIIIDEETILFAGVENGSWQAMITKSNPFVKFFVEFFYHDVALTRITKKYEEQLLKDEEIKQLLLRLRY